MLLELSDPVRSSLIETMHPEELVHAAERLDSDDIADLVPDFPGHVVQGLLQRLNQENRTQVESVLAFPEDTVGALMDFDLVAVLEDVSLDVVLRYLRRLGKLPEASDRLMVVDRDGLLEHGRFAPSGLAADQQARSQSLFRFRHL